MFSRGFQPKPSFATITGKGDNPIHQFHWLDLGFILFEGNHRRYHRSVVILLMATRNPANQLRLVVSTIIYDGFYTSQVVHQYQGCKTGTKHGGPFLLFIYIQHLPQIFRLQSHPMPAAQPKIPGKTRQ